MPGRHTRKASSSGGKSRAGLKPVEKKQVRMIALTLDNKGKQKCEKLLSGPDDEQNTGTTYVNHAYPGIPSSADLMRLLPSIQQSGITDSGTVVPASRERRLGSKIKLTKLNCQFMFHIPPAVTASNDTASVQCRLLILSCKSIKKFSLLKAQWEGGSTQNLSRRYLKQGDQETSFQGDLWSLRFPVNTALFTKHYDKRFIINRGLPQTTGNAGGRTVPDAIRTINVNLKVKNKYIRFPEPGLSENEDYAPFAILMYAPTNGGHTTVSAGCVSGKSYTLTNWKNLM